MDCDSGMTVSRGVRGLRTEEEGASSYVPGVMVEG